MKTSWFFQSTFQTKNLNSMDLLLVTNENKSHVFTKDFDRCFTKQRIKSKNTLSRVVCSVLVVKMC